MYTFAVIHLFKDMSKLIEQSFAHRDASEGRDIIDGRCDLTGPNGEIILQSLWESLVNPGWEVKMKMWEPTVTNKLPVRFKDVIGRKFSLPFHQCATWKVRFTCSHLAHLFRHLRPVVY